jgi:tRNA(Ile)-lysidine synthase TilS/MesJ
MNNTTHTTNTTVSTNTVVGSHANMRAWRHSEMAKLARRLKENGNVSIERGTVVVATAHHLDDQEETMLMKWIRYTTTFDRLIVWCGTL